MTDVQDTLQDRGKLYSPDPEHPYRIFELKGKLICMLLELYGDTLTYGQIGIIMDSVSKFARIIEGGINGVYHEDNVHDTDGYYRLLVGCSKGVPPGDVT